MKTNARLLLQLLAITSMALAGALPARAEDPPPLPTTTTTTPSTTATDTPTAATGSGADVTPAPAAAAADVVARPEKETECSDGVDNDGDGVTDCGDADCRGLSLCQPDGKPENTNERCGDWIDNDKDGIVDCDDSECARFPVCQGSWKGPVDGNGEGGVANEGGNAPAATKRTPGIEAADSNDGIGFVGVRFGIVAGVLQELDIDNAVDAKTYVNQMDTRINLLQLRAFGQLPYLDDSFFMVSIRGEVSPRLTFAMFQVPLGGGHYLNVNTGGGSLSNSLILSAAKEPLLEPAFWMTSAFEQGNSAAVEVTGPILPGALRYRGFVGGGAGFTNGNVGNRHFTFNNLNYTYTVGGQLQSSPVGNYDRFDSPFLYKEVPLAVGFVVGGKYDQREQERFPAVNALAAVRWGRFELSLEDYAKAELNFGAIQNAYDVTLGVLVVPEWLFFAVDGGQFYTSAFGALQDNFGVPVSKPPAALVGSLRGERTETDVRAALHFFFWRNNGVVSTRYTLQLQDPSVAGPDVTRTDAVVTHSIWLTTQFRF